MLNLYAPNNNVLKYIRQKPRQGEEGMAVNDGRMSTLLPALTEHVERNQ